MKKEERSERQKDIVKALEFSVKYGVSLTLLSEDAAIILGMISDVEIGNNVSKEEVDDDSEGELYTENWR